MNGLKIILWLCAVAFLLGFPLLVTPWDTINDMIGWFGVEPLPPEPLVMYLMRMSCGLLGVAGVFFVLLARNPLGYGLMLDLSGYGLIAIGLVAPSVGLSLGLPAMVFVADTVFALAFGTAIITLAHLQRKARST